MSLSTSITAVVQQIAAAIKALTTVVDGKLPKAGGSVTGAVNFGSAGSIVMTARTGPATATYTLQGSSTASSGVTVKVQVGSASFNLLTMYGANSASLGYLSSDFRFKSLVGFEGPLIGNADTATKLATPRTINGVTFDGSTNITLPSLTQRMHVQDRRTSGTNGQSYSSMTVAQNITRELNTILVDGITGATLDGNKVTLTAAGTYRVRAALTASTTPAAAMLFDAVNGVSLGESLTLQSPSATGGAGTMTVEGTVTVASGATASVEIRQYIPAAMMAGVAVTPAMARGIAGYREVYANLVIEKVA